MECTVNIIRLLVSYLLSVACMMPAGAGAGSGIIVPPRGKCAEEVL